MTELPTGTVTFLFTDIEGSSRLWEEQPDVMRLALARHDALLRAAIETNGGTVFKTMGDQFCAAFATAAEAVDAALAIQQCLRSAELPVLQKRQPLQVRVALHTGTAETREGDYFGPALNRVARLLAAEHGGQILLSAATQELVQDDLPAGASLRDLGRHRLRDLQRPEHVFQLVHPALPGDFPPLRSADARPHNLLVQVTSFVGRRRELADLTELLARTRLLTLTGPGGSGKTRLAQQLGSSQVGEFADGVWWVDLSEASEPDSVLPQIAAALRLPVTPEPDLKTQVLQSMAERELLLILDNFEGVLGASLLVSDLLKAAPRVRYVVTSRIALRLRGEQVFALNPMALPDPVEDCPGTLLACDSVKLLVERARAVRPDFALSERTARDVSELCRALDGIPLGIELAAAQLADLSPAEVLESLRSNLELLQSDSPDVPERHRTMTAAVEWSYRLLDPLAQDSLQRFSVFAGGWFREAAESLCGPASLAALRTLHRHSLVGSMELADGRTRYHLLGTVRNFGRALLSRRCDAARETRSRHSRYYLELARRHDGRLRGPEEVAALRELDGEVENLRAGMDWAIESADGELAAAYAAALFRYLTRRALFDEAEHRTRTALAATGPVPNLLRNLASCHHDRGRWKDGILTAAEALDRYREAGDRGGGASTLNLLGLLYQESGDLEQSRICFLEALELVRGGETTGITADIFHNLGHAAQTERDFQQADRYYRECVRQVFAGCG